MSLKKYSRVESEQFEELIALNEHCIELLDKESYENLLSLFEKRNELTQSVVIEHGIRDNHAMLQELSDYDKVIMAKVIDKKSACSQSLSAFYRRDNAKNEYIETQNNLLNYR